MDDKNKAVQNKELSLSEAERKILVMMLWPVFLVLLISGISAFVFFPLHVGYGLVATIIFRAVAGIVLFFVVRKFARAIIKLSRSDENKGG